MHYVLLKEIRCCNDEYDTESFIVMPMEEYQQYVEVTQKTLENYFCNHSNLKYKFGPNQYHIIENVADYWNSIYATEITEKEFLMFKILFGSPNHNIIRFGTNSYFFPIEQL